MSHPESHNCSLITLKNLSSSQFWSYLTLYPLLQDSYNFLLGASSPTTLISCQSAINPQVKREIVTF